MAYALFARLPSLGHDGGTTVGKDHAWTVVANSNAKPSFQQTGMLEPYLLSSQITNRATVLNSDLSEAFDVANTSKTHNSLRNGSGLDGGRPLHWPYGLLLLVFRGRTESSFSLVRAQLETAAFLWQNHLNDRHPICAEFVSV